MDLKTFKKKWGLSQKQLCFLLDVSLSTVSRIEYGKGELTERMEDLIELSDEILGLPQARHKRYDRIMEVLHPIGFYTLLCSKGYIKDPKSYLGTLILMSTKML